VFEGFVGNILLLLLLGSTPVVAIALQPWQYEGIITIRYDGSIDPPFAPIISYDHFTYVLTSDTTCSIVVERNDIVLNGNGHALFSTAIPDGVTTIGITALNVSNVTIKSMEVRSFYEGIRLEYCGGCNIVGNNMSDNHNSGVGLVESYDSNVTGNRITGGNIGVGFSGINNIVSENNIAGSNMGVFCSGIYNIVSGNNIAENDFGIYLYYSKNESIIDNAITNNDNGVWLSSSTGVCIAENDIENNTICGIASESSFNNTIYHNNIVDNTCQHTTYDSVNLWDNGYPSGGNYWSDYVGMDEKAGADQNEPGSDTIGDAPYEVDAINKDRYPLMKPWSILASDLNRDRTVNVLDLTIVATAFGSISGEPEYNAVADLDKNRVINIIDVSIVAKDFGKTN
jgi:parallel beta-helix repeat protein